MHRFIILALLPLLLTACALETPSSTHGELSASRSVPSGGVVYGVRVEDGVTWAYIESTAGEEIIAAPWNDRTGIMDWSQARYLGLTEAELAALEDDDDAAAPYYELLLGTSSAMAAYLWEGALGLPPSSEQAVSYLSQAHMTAYEMHLVGVTGSFALTGDSSSAGDAEPAEPTEIEDGEGWTANGCTNSPDFDFKHCCDEHDACYCAGGDAADRKACDEALRECIEDAGHPWLAKIYYRAVRAFGDSHFNYD